MQQSVIFFQEEGIPRWQEVPVGQLCIYGPDNGVFVRRSHFGSGVPLVNVSDLYHSSRVDVTILERVRIDDDKLGRFLLKSGDVLVNRSSLKLEGLGHSCLFEGAPEPVVFECHIMRIRFDPDRVVPLLFVMFMNSSLGLKRILHRAKLGTMTAWNQRDLKSVPYPLPPIAEQRRIIEYLDGVQAQVADLKRLQAESAAELERLSGAVLARAFQGKL